MVSYFQNLISQSAHLAPLRLEEVAPFIDKCLERDQWQRLITKVSTEEIKNTLFNMADDKAPWPDGFIIKFFKKAWEFVGPVSSPLIIF